jgi:nucleoside-triphosphatase THEP1
LPALGRRYILPNIPLFVADAQSCDARGCRLDDQRLGELADRLTAAIDDGPDLVVINRFGRAEAEGRGLVKPIAQALKADIPVLIAVPERRFFDWIRFSDGMNVVTNPRDK